MIRTKEFTFTSKVATQDRKKDSEKRRNIPKHGSINSLPVYALAQGQVLRFPLSFHIPPKPTSLSFNCIDNK